MTPCPGCGRYPTGAPLVCTDCYDPVEDCSDLERLQACSVAEWDAGVQAVLDGWSSAVLRGKAWHAAACYEKLRQSRWQRLERMYRDEITRRHHACTDTIPPPPSIPREERDTVRPGVALGYDCGFGLIANRDES